MSDEERSDSLQSVEIPNEMYQQAFLNNNGASNQSSEMNISVLPADLHQLEVMTGMSQQTLNDLSAPSLRIIEQPKQRGFRFRYDCEGPSHGGLPGQHSLKGKKTYPSVEILNYTGPARIVVSLVTSEDLPKPHAHSIVGKHCNDGLCTVQVGPTDMTASFPNLGILHVTRKNVEKVLKDRLREQQKLYRTLLGEKGFVPGAQHLLETEPALAKKAKEMAKEMDLSKVCLCFQAYLPDGQGHYTRPLAPAISLPIFDSKAPGATTLKICRMDKSSGCVTGNDEVYLLCDKVQKDDIYVRFFEMNPNGETVWEAYADFGPTDVHRQFAIVFKTPKYKDCYISRPAYVQVQLQRRSDKEVSDPKPFTYHPQLTDKESILRKRRKHLPLFQDHFLGGNGGKGGGGFGGSGGGSDGRSGYPFSPEQPINMNFTGGRGGGGPTNSFQAPPATMATQQNIAQRNQQHQIIMQQLQQQQQQQQQQNHQGGVFQSRGISVESDQDTVKSTREMEVVQDTQPAVLPTVSVLGEREIDSDLEVDSLLVEDVKETQVTKGPVRIFESLVQSGVGIVEQAKISKDTSVQTDDIPLDYESLAWRLAERTSRALRDFAITADIKMLLAVQRHLTAVEDENGDTPLHLAIIHKKYDVALGLLNVIISIPQQKIINHHNKLHQTPLHVAVITEQLDIVELLLRCGADPNIMDHAGNMPIHLAAQNRLSDITAVLARGVEPLPGKSDSAIEPIPTEINLKNLDGFTAAHISVQLADLKNLKVLVKNGADVNVQDGKSGRTTLHYAVEQSNFSLLGYLIADADADIHVQTFAGDTPLHLACSLDYVAVAAVLVSAGAEPSIENFDTSSNEMSGETGVISDEGHVEIFEDEYNGEILSGKTSLDLACSERMVKILNGEDYISTSASESTPRVEESLVSTNKTSISGYKSYTSTVHKQTTSLRFTPTGDLNRLDSLTRQKLSSLLDEIKPHRDWLSLADHLGLGNMINQLKQFDSPTSILLDQYEAMDGTVAELTSVLKGLNREDAINVIAEIGMPMKKAANPLIKDLDRTNQVDSGLASSLQSVHLTGDSVFSSHGPAKCHLNASQSSVRNVAV